ncbi:uncharacterized protein LOC143912765 [Arctopsyche grandis]|uniref:uncharacterized protein LOC143912765 n=1 Tax=Arctopsyche grandis TaxID=121162 RepID=UPI00406D830F
MQLTTIALPLPLLLLLLLFILSLVSAQTPSRGSAQLESVNDDDLLALIRQEKYVVALFTKPDCPTCLNMEKTLIEARDELVDFLGAWVVMAQQSHLMRLYSPNAEPALVFFRHGVPLLYDGPVDEEHITQTFNDNKEPIARELSDDNFEHLTQAATGATTGDWFVMFYSSSCLECQRLGAVWEAVGAATRVRGIVVARADRGGAAAATARRFGVTKDPTFLLFRKGKMYWYDLPKYGIKSLISFSQDWYRNAKSEKVPIPKSPFDDLVAWCVYLIRDVIEFGLGILTEHPWIWQIGVVGFGLVAITSIIAVVKAGKSSSPKPVTKKPSKKTK